MARLTVRQLARERVAPLLEGLRADGLTPDLEDGQWLGAVEGNLVLGVARIFERAGLAVLDDVWVRGDRRAHGVGGRIVAHAKTMRSRLWLICDEDDVGFYTRRGFTAMPPEEFPRPLAELYESKGEWPGPGHVHIPMVWEGLAAGSGA